MLEALRADGTYLILTIRTILEKRKIIELVGFHGQNLIEWKAKLFLEKAETSCIVVKRRMCYQY